ncbi:hypothetical protein AVEN_142113-1 [Araneus ventricosus]|uniref:Uncharacterized protein n=1 Tax=Araneus ventricosus TaxID=182803 RepID=A0A4Y2DFB0_ARAVE|nr:hypothetical protein AVEN_142113-1 [Araneus ventricosus]
MQFCHCSYTDVNADYKFPFTTFSCTFVAALLQNLRIVPFKQILHPEKKSHGARSGKYAGWKVPKCDVLIGNLTLEGCRAPAPQWSTHDMTFFVMGSFECL